MTEEEKKAIEFVKKRTKELKKYAKRENEITCDDIVLNLIKKLQKENEELKEDLENVLNQTLGAFEKNWCIDWNFTEIREKYNLESEK